MSRAILLAWAAGACLCALGLASLLSGGGARVKAWRANGDVMPAWVAPVAITLALALWPIALPVMLWQSSRSD